MSNVSVSKDFIFLNTTFSSATSLSVLFRSFFGIGQYSIKIMCARFGLKPGALVKDVPLALVKELELYILNSFRFGREYERFYSRNKSFKIKAGFRAGIRMSQGLPSRGQRSRTNASTAKMQSAKFLNS